MTTVVDVRPLSGYTGAEILGVDLTELTFDVVTAIRDALLRWKVVFFRDQRPQPREQHIAFGRAFGELTRAHPTIEGKVPGHPQILEVPSYAAGTKSWHSDVTFVVNPPMGSILRAVVVPPYGGDTQFTNLVRASEQLSPEIRELVDRLHAVHRNELNNAHDDRIPTYSEQFRSKTFRTVHPVVRVHPETAGRAIFVNPLFTSHIRELSRREGSHLLALLYEHIAGPELTCRFRWEPGSIAFWDNRATCHLAPADIPDGYERTMERITIAGDTPVGVDGAPSYSIAGEAFS